MTTREVQRIRLYPALEKQKVSNINNVTMQYLDNLYT